MTNDFKDKIFKWLTGNYNVEKGNNIPIFSEATNRTNNFETEFNTLFPNGYFLTGILQGQDINNNGVGFSIMYGAHYDEDFDYRGFIVILDEDFDIVQVITRYNNGNKIYKLEVLGVGDDGNFFGIDNYQGTKRFIMLNNIIAKLPNQEYYQVVLRQSYNLVGECNHIETYSKIVKAPSQSKYIIAGTKSNQYAVGTELTINVGSSNNWVDYTNNEDKFVIVDIYATWNSQGELLFKLAGFVITNNTELTYGELTGNSTYEDKDLILLSYGSIFDDVISFDIKKINLYDSYISMCQYDSNDNSKAYMRIYYFHNNTLNLIKAVYTIYDPGISLRLYSVGNEVFYLYNSSYPLGAAWEMYIGKLIGSKDYESYVTDFGNHADTTMFIVEKQFNLYNYFIQIGDVVYNVKQIYNSNNYNGEEYQGLNSMIPNNATLSSNGVVIYARNLYNRIVNNNTTTSILNVPNDFINGIEIDNEKLYSETNNILSNRSISITTNIYEELMINFINTLLMSNHNNANNIIENISGAIRLNQSISSTNDYSNCYIGKYKINYDDNTSEIKDVDRNLIYTNLSTTYNIVVYVPVSKNIVSIQLLSNDENTIYQTIECNNFENNKYYMITQDVSIS